MAEEKFLYPASPETVHKYAASIFSPILRGECVSTVWVPMAGRRIRNKFIVENIERFEEELPNHQNYLLVYIEPLDLTENSLSGYLRLIGKKILEECKKRVACDNILKESRLSTIFEDESSTYGKLLEALKDCFRGLREIKLHTVLFMGEFDEFEFANNVFYGNLKALWEEFQPFLHYIFMTVVDVTSQGWIQKVGELNAAMLQNVVYVPISEKEDEDYLISYFEKQFTHPFSGEEKQLIKKLCGGHPYLIKSVCRIITQVDGNKQPIESLQEIVLNHYEPTSAAKKIFTIRTDSEKMLLHDLFVGKKITLANGNRALEKLRLIQKDDQGGYHFFGELFKMAVAGETHENVEPKTDAKQGLTYDEKSGEILYSGLPVEEKFTRQEYEILKLFLVEPNKLKSRDDIGDVLWGKEAYDKYSDWAIDQLISKLRKKLDSLSLENNIVTVKGRGYKFVP